MRFVRVFILVFLAHSETWAQGAVFRWAFEIHMGEMRAAISARGNSWFVVTCNALFGPPSLGVELTIRGTEINQDYQFQMIVDSEVYIFNRSLDTFGSRSRFMAAIGALSHSRSSNFIVEVPEVNLSQAFSLSNATYALSQDRLRSFDARYNSPVRGGRTFADTCGTY